MYELPRINASTSRTTRIKKAAFMEFSPPYDSGIRLLYPPPFFFGQNLVQCGSYLRERVQVAIIEPGDFIDVLAKVPNFQLRFKCVSFRTRQRGNPCKNFPRGRGRFLPKRN